MSKLALVLDIAKTYDVLFTMKLRLVGMTCYLTLYISGGRSELCHLQGYKVQVKENKRSTAIRQ